MATDMDIDMDLDLGPIEDDAPFKNSLLSFNAEPQPLTVIDTTSTSQLNPDAAQVVPNKIHLRGLDNLDTSDLVAFVSEHFNGMGFEKVEWIDDTSANLLYETPAVAMQAFTALADTDVSDISQIQHMQMIAAKSVPSHPETRLYIRLAVVGDKKQAGARVRSRYYLFNPDHDPTERRRRGGNGRRGEKRYRDRYEDHYGDRDGSEPFDVSLYDDDEITRAVRSSRSHGNKGSRSSVSSGENQTQTIRRARSSGKIVKELFPNRVARRRQDGGRLRNRSASPVRESMEISEAAQPRSRLRNSNLIAAANRLQAQAMKARLKEASIEAKELFPYKSGINHRRSDAFDATDATADLFATRLPVPFMDGSSDIPPQKRDLMSRTKKSASEDAGFLGSSSDQNGINIRGTAGELQPTGIFIKGMALDRETSIKELFPHKAGLNAGKELFSEKLEGRGGRRQRAEDMFY